MMGYAEAHPDAHGERLQAPPHRGWTLRRPHHPGEFLQTRFLQPLHLSQTELAAALGISRRRVNELINGRRAITPDSALRLSAYFGNDAAFWMQLQMAWDMHAALQQTLRPRPPRPAARAAAP